MDTEQLLVTVLGAGGGGAVLLALINGLFKWLSGASSRERTRNTNIASQRSKAIVARDNADKQRRGAEEHNSALKRQLIENGLIPVERIIIQEADDGRT